jgi:hypothetical protein
MSVIYAVFLCLGVQGTAPCHLSYVAPDREVCEMADRLYLDHRLRCAYREVLPEWSALSDR